MNPRRQPSYDVIIMGGGPAGSTLGALLANSTNLRIGLFDKEVFPRDHIGESFAHPLIPVLEESGALPKVLASDCWVKKYGGVFNWDPEGPSVAYFDHANWLADGVHRWAFHVNRSEFDHILLNHARDCGAEVFEGVGIRALHPRSDGVSVTLDDGDEVRGSFFVDASGRHNSIATGKKRSWLSSYKNLAIWQHFEGGRPVQSLPGDWNIFRDGDRSPIGCFAFEDGWCWYIPVPKVVDGERRLTYSVGIVTTPSVLRKPGSDFTDPAVFLETVRRIPLVGELMQEATPVANRMHTATNYSMINEQFASFDERWLLIGDASYFVDPLFSSGVAFAAAQASAAALLLRTTVDPGVAEQHKRDLWRDYDVEWHGMAETFALSIDQWYHAIGRNNPQSAYWRTRGGTMDLGIREQTFHALLNTFFTPDLLQVMTNGTRDMADLDSEGPFVRAQTMADPGEPQLGSLLSRSPRVAVRASLGVDVPGFKAFIPPAPFDLPPDIRAAIARYWIDPVRNGEGVPPLLDAPAPCHRFYFDDEPGGAEVRSIDYRDDGLALWDMLGTERKSYGELVSVLSVPQTLLLKRLMRAGMVTVQRSAASDEPGVVSTGHRA